MTPAGATPAYLQARRLPAWSHVLAVLALAATTAGAGSLARSGVFDWHAAQPAFIEGGLELLGLLLAVFAALRWQRRLHWLLAGLLVLFFLRRHAVDLALLASSAYCLGIVGIGMLAERALRLSSIDDASLNLGRRAALGLALLTLCLWIPSLVWGLSFEQARIGGIALALIGCSGLGFAWRGKREGGVLTNALAAMPTARAAPWSLMLVTCLAVLARSNAVLYYDSLWYALRPDRVLFGEHGIYSFLGLTTQVHYYPKLFEVAMAPLQGWGDLSFEAGFNAFALMLLAVAVRGLAQTTGIGNATAWLVAASIVCLPATAGAAEAAKGDVLASALVLFALQAILKIQRGAPAARLGLVLLLATLASAIRLTALPPLAVLFVAAVVVWALRFRAEGRGAMSWLAGREGAVAALGVAAALLVHARTFLLAGTPVITNASMQALFDQWGLAVQFPIGGLTGGEPARGWRGLVDLFGISLQPSGYQFHVFKWSGGVWLAALAVCAGRLALGPSRGQWVKANAILLAVGMLLPLLLSLNSWPAAGGDGNYFIVPAVCLVVAACAGLQPSKLLDAALTICTAMTLGFFLLTSNWVPGTAAFDWGLARSPYDARAQVAKYLDAAGLGYLGNYLSTCDRHTRVLGLLPDHGQGFALPVRYEPLQELAWNNGREMATKAGFGRLLRSTGTQLLVLPASQGLPQSKTNRGLDATLRAYVSELEAGGQVQLLTQRGDYHVYRLVEAAPLRGCGP